MAELPKTVAIVDDQPLFRMGLRAALEHEHRFRVVFETDCSHQALEWMRDERVDLAIIDLLLDGITGPHLIAELSRKKAGLHILSLSVFDDPKRIAEVLRAGATGYAHKRCTASMLLDAIEHVVSGERYLPPDCAVVEIERLACGREPSLLEQLTAREREVFSLLIDGCTNDDIAKKLFIARRTVETHRHHVLHKLSARSVVDLVRIAVRHGISVR